MDRDALIHSYRETASRKHVPKTVHTALSLVVENDDILEVKENEFVVFNFNEKKKTPSGEKEGHQSRQ